MLTSSEAYRRIRGIHLKALRNVEDAFAGAYRSVFKGQGLEFEEVKEYYPGDDIRSIDWNVTARLQKPFIKSFREERELTIFFLIDLSASSKFSHTAKSKGELIAEIGALLAFCAIKNHDNVGLILFSDQIELYLKPKKGLRHVLRVIREILFFKPKNKGTNLKEALIFLGKVHKKKTVTFLISDFLTDSFEKEAKVLSQNHELIAFEIYDNYEKEGLPPGFYRLKDLETDQEHLLDASNKQIIQNLRASTLEREQELKQTFNKLGIDLFSISTNEESAEALHRFFKLRERKR